jgi:DNA-binding XRE family transcriptional regulator
MDKHELEALEAAGFEVTTVAEFLGLTEVEEKIVEFRLKMSRGIRARREAKGWTQKDLAKAIGSSQPRVAKIEAGSPDVSLDLMMRGYFAVGGELPDEPSRARSRARVAVRPAVAGKPKAKAKP